MGSLKSPCTTSYRSSIKIIAINCLVFEKIAFFCILATETDKRTDEQVDSERRLRKPTLASCSFVNCTDFVNFM